MTTDQSEQPTLVSDGTGWLSRPLDAKQQELLDSLITDFIFGRDSSDVFSAYQELEDQIHNTFPKLSKYLRPRFEQVLEDPRYSVFKDQYASKKTR